MLTRMDGFTAAAWRARSRHFFLCRQRTILADIVAKVFCSSERETLIQNRAEASKVDSKAHASRFDCFRFRFHSICSVTFATWGNSGIVPYEGTRNQLSSNMRPCSCGLATMESYDGALCRTGRVV